MTNSLNPIITVLVAGCNNLNVQTGLNFTPLVVTPFVDAQFFADSPNGNAINPVINQIVGFLNQVTYKSQPNITQLASSLGITPAQLNQSFNNQYSNTNYNNQILNTIYAPSNLQGTVNGTEIDLSWTSNSNNQIGYHVYRSTDNINFSIIASPTETTYNDTGLSAGTYYYKVSAYNAQGESPMSNEINKTISNNPILAFNNFMLGMFNFQPRIYKSLDNGLTFPTYNVLSNPEPYLFGDMCTLSNGDILATKYNTNEIHKSIDGGLTFNLFSTTPESCWGITTLSSGDILAVDVNGGISYKSTNGGISFNSYGTCPDIGTNTMCTLLNGDILLQYSEDTDIYKSTNGGLSFSSFGTHAPGFWGITTLSSGDILAVGANGTISYKSTNGGSTFNPYGTTILGLRCLN